MTTNNPNQSVNYIPFLSEAMQRTLRRLAWKDEDFREALVADPKGIIQQVFPHCFPDGKLPDDLTINVVEQDPHTRHIVLPAFADEEMTLEIPEEDQLDLIVNLGSIDRKRSRESDDSQQSSKSTSKRKFDYLRQRDKENQPPTEREKLDQALRQDPKFREKLVTNASEAIEQHFPEHFSKSKVPDGYTFKVLQDTPDTRHIVIPLSRDASRAPELPHEERQRPGPIGSGDACSGNCQTGIGCPDPQKSTGPYTCPD